MNTYNDTAFIIHPGLSLEEAIEYKGMSQKEFAHRTGLTPKTINEIIKGKNPITPENSLRFERVLNIVASFWNNLQKNYDEDCARKKAHDALIHQETLLQKYSCYNELAKLGYVRKTRDLKERIMSLLSFFRVNSLDFVYNLQNVSFRMSEGHFLKECLIAWLQCGDIEAEKITVNEFNASGLKEAISEIRALTFVPEGFSVTLQRICAQYGVAVVYTPYFKNTKVNGATRWINNKPVIQLNTRGAFSDIFWFTFFHELGHILLHGKKESFLEFDNKEITNEEQEADIFASEYLIPNSYIKDFINNNNFSHRAIIKFSNIVEIDPGIIVGRLARMKHITWAHASKLRKKLIFTNPVAV